jgi:hypothetical protein
MTYTIAVVRSQRSKMSTNNDESHLKQTTNISSSGVRMADWR